MLFKLRKKAVEDKLENVTLKSAPTKLEYIKGEELSLIGGKLELIYKIKDPEEIDITSQMVTGYNKETIGKQTIKVTYEGFEVSFEITVVEKEESVYITFRNLDVLEENETKYVIGINPKTTMDDLLSARKIETENTIEVYKGTEKIENSKVIGTGYVLNVIKGEETRSYVLVVKGDCTGDGKADFNDMLKINKHRLNKKKLEGEYLKAGDVTKDGKADFNDMLRINKFRLGKITEFKL